MLAGGILETVDLLRGQIFPLPHIGVARPAWRNCPIYDGRGAACFAESRQFSPWAITTKFRGWAPAIRGTGIMECQVGRTYSGLMFANFTTLPHFSVSSVISLPKSAGEPGRTVSPISAIRAFILGSARTSLMTLLSNWIVSAGAFFGAPIPKNALAS